MITQVTSIEQLKQIWIEMLMNKTSKVTKVSDGSVLNGIAYGCAKVGQKILKDVAIIEGHIFPDSAYGQYLDGIAANYGIAPRFGPTKSSMYVRIVGTPGTTYVAGLNTFTGGVGIVFDLISDFTIGADGWGYAQIRSQTTGSNTIVDPLSINIVSPIPTGHQYVVNEYMSQGGMDEEDDDTFRQRIKEGVNILATKTVSFLEQLFMKINNNVLRVFYQGINGSGQTVLAILTQDGSAMTTNELNTISSQAAEYLALTDLKPNGITFNGILLQNITYQPIDISIRAILNSGVNPDNVRKAMQIQAAKVIDYRFWESGDIVYFSDLIQAMKGVSGVNHIMDNFFFPNLDVQVDPTKLPRIRGFLLLDQNGNLISSGSGSLNPLYYPAVADFSFQQTVLSSIS